MTGPSPETLEGRLIAQRKVLALIVARLSAGPAAGPTLLDLLDPHETFIDHQEDPGAIPTEAYAIGGAVADELRQITEAARRHLRNFDGSE